MTQAESDRAAMPIGAPDSAEIGLALLLSGGIADAMTMVEATLGVARSAATQVLAGLTRVQAVGAAAASVPPAVGASTASEPPAEAGAGLAERSPPPAPSIATPMTSAGEGAPPALDAALAPARAAEPPVRHAETLAAPQPSVPGAGPLAPARVEAGGVADRWLAAPAAATRAITPAPGEAMRAMAPVPLALFAPMQAARPADARDLGSDQAQATPADPAQPGATPPALAPDPATSTGAPFGPAAGAAPARAYAPPPPPAAHSGPTGGDVFLDGTRVGTWIADHLAREAGRPQMGATDFDPRLTPAWPGTLQGA